MTKKIMTLVAGLLVFGMTVNAQTTQTWDPDGNGTSDGGNGTWATSANNWITASPWVNGNNAIFGDSGANYTVNIADGGVTVGDLTYSGSNKLQLKSVTDNLGRITIKSGGATWNTGGGEIEFLNNQLNDTPLSISSGDTLTIAGGGVFDAGEKNNGADWVAAGATLDLTSATTVRGNAVNIGKFEAVNLAGGSTYINERNANQTLGVKWGLGSGVVSFGSRYSRQAIYNDVVSGVGTLEVKYNSFNETAQDYSVALNAANTFTGGVIVDGTAATTILQINQENRLGATPGSFDADNITLRNGGYLRINQGGGGMTLNANRGITLDGGGGIINGSGPHTLNGAITGTGGLEIGRAGDNFGNTITFNSAASDYTGETKITRGKIILGTDNALSSETVVAVSGSSASTSALVMNGKDVTIAGLRSEGTNTRQLENDGGSASTLTLNVGTGESYTYGANLTGADAINIVKTGDGTQTFNRAGGFSTDVGTIEVNGGLLVWNVLGGGATSVGTGGTLGGSGTFDGAVTVAGNLNPGNSPGTLTFNDALTLESTATTTLELTGLLAGEFDVLANDGGDTLTLDGILAFDTTGYTAVLGDSFLVFDNWGTIAGSFSSITGTDLGGGLSLELAGSTVSVIPEPATLGLVLALGGGLLWIRRVFMV
ncbi:beta strand repeat-containing protein [Pontiella sulfatireligans]|uniref:PEP-CTERM protein-sorting domain-containing protein n=1 Tax=Pontiella sulfatireligans TaxID=2750658 RepID=A0A6C2UHP9_9BACT|nr:PEP-CTERM sorting domain-containing protein [Pontiella sulfatireligans]VGO19393.1 hypothetical protein SCARR_01451 [Pontiella sulfatireligans]